MSTGRFTRKQLEVHNHRHNAVVVIDNLVYDLTEFLDDHPGGVDVLLDRAGQDASQCFHDVGHSDIALDWRKKFEIGEVVEEDRRPVVTRAVYTPEPDAPAGLRAQLAVWGPPLLLAGLAALLYAYLFP